MRFSLSTVAVVFSAIMADFGVTFDSNLCDGNSDASGIFKIPARPVDDGINGNGSKRQINLHIGPNEGSWESELPSLLRQIVDRNSGCKRVEVLRDLRALIRKSEGKLPDVDRMQFFEAFYPMLADQKSKIVSETSMLIIDIIPQMGEHDLDPCMSIILPRVIPNLGHESTEVRRASLRLLHVYMRYTNNLQKALRMYIQYGLENNDKSAQKGCVLSLPLLFTEEFSKENLFPLVKSLGHLLVHAQETLFYPIFLAMQRLHTLVGNETFKLYLQHLQPETVDLYQKVLSRSSTADSTNKVDPVQSANINENQLTDTDDRGETKNDAFHRQLHHHHHHQHHHHHHHHRRSRDDAGKSDSKQTKLIDQSDQQPNEEEAFNGYLTGSSSDTIPIERLITTTDVPRHFRNLSPQELDEAKRAFISSMSILQKGASISDEEGEEQEEDKEVEEERRRLDEMVNIPANFSDRSLMKNDNFRDQNAMSSGDDGISIGSEFKLAYGIFPIAVINRTLSEKILERVEGVHQMLNIMKESPTTHFAILANYLPSFMENIITPLVDDYNFKVTISGLEMLEISVERLRLSAYPYLKQIVGIALKRLGDCRAVVRERDTKLIHRLMFHFPLQNVLSEILEYKHHRNPKVREEIINRVTVALLMFPRSEFNLNRLSYEIASMLIDPKRTVRLAAIECLAVIAQALGHHRLTSLLLIVQAIEQATQSEGLVTAVQVRKRLILLKTRSTFS